MSNYWSTLGLQAGAPLAEVKNAFRNLAKQFHPDLNPGCHKSEKRFKEISAAYDVLKTGNVPQEPVRAQSRHQRRSQTFYVHLTLKEAAWGHRWVHTDHGSFPLPNGVRDDDVVTYDAYTKIHFTVSNTHGVFRRRGDDLWTSLEVKERDLEAKRSHWFTDHPGMKTPRFTLDPATMKDGTTVRIKNHGMPKLKERGGGYGHVFVELKVVPTPSLWARRNQRETWNSSEQLLIATLAALILVTGVMAISLGIVTFLLP